MVSSATPRLSGQKLLAKKYGMPAVGMAWCTGYKVDHHQVPVDDMIPKTTKCRGCRNRANDDYRASRPPRKDNRIERQDLRPSEEDVRYVAPGRKPPANGQGKGITHLKSWGYGPVDQDPTRGSRSGMHYNERLLVA